MSLIIRFKKSNGKTTYSRLKDEYNYREFVKRLPEGGYFDMYLEEVTLDHSLPQLAKVHAMIRDLAKHLGYSPSDVKLLVKERAGLCYTRTHQGKEVLYCKSFGDDCSKEELGLAIQACIEIGHDVNLLLE